MLDHLRITTTGERDSKASGTETGLANDPLGDALGSSNDSNLWED